MKSFVAVIVAIFVAMLFQITFFTEIPTGDFLDVTEKQITFSGIQQAHLPFIENQGQISSNSVKYYAKTFAGTIFITDHDLTYHSIKRENNATKSLAIKEKFLGEVLKPTGVDKNQAVVSYFKGKADNWQTNISTFDTVSLGTVWPNIDVDLKAHGNNVEKIFTVHPGGRPSDIKIIFDGISTLSSSKNNDLVVDTELGSIVLSEPLGYQIISGKKSLVDVSYILYDERTYGFSILSYDPRYDLVIDPLIASTYLGGSDEDTGEGIALDSSGNVYVVGETQSLNFPTTVGAYNTTNNGTFDVFVSKFNNNLSSLLASTYIGGDSFDFGLQVAVDSSNNVYITGHTFDSAIDYPTTAGAFNTTHSGDYDVFVSKLNSSLTSLLASTLIGGSSTDTAFDIILNGTSTVVITGLTADGTTDLPTSSTAFDTTHNGNDDGYISIFNDQLTQLRASTFLGGLDDDSGVGLTLDGTGNVIVAGRTNSTAFPTTGGAYDTTHNGLRDGFVSKMNSDLSLLLASTFIGGSSMDSGEEIALDSSGNVYITGFTHDGVTDLPTTSGVFDETANGEDDIFVSKFNSALASLLASTFLGGSGNEVALGLAVDSSNNVYLTGHTGSSANFPITNGAFDTSYNGGSHDAYAAKFNSALTNLISSTFLGGSGDEIGIRIEIDSSSNIYIAGEAGSGYPTTSGAYDTSFNGMSDVFITKTDSCLSGSCVTIVTTGSSVTVEVPAGAPATFDLPADTQLAVTPPVDANVTATDTDSGQSASTISFLGTIVDITATREDGSAACATGCTIQFTFTGAQAASQGLSPSQVVIYHDSNGNGSFETSEALSTTIVGDDPFTATATASFTSKFAVGGVKALAIAAAALSIIGQPGGCDPDGFGSGISLRVYSISYDKCETNKIDIVAHSTCGPISSEVASSYGTRLAAISDHQPYFKDVEKRVIYSANLDPDLESVNVIIKDQRDSFVDKILLKQCSATKSYTHTTGYTSGQQGPLFGNNTQQNSTQTTPIGLAQKQNELAIPSWIKSNAKWWSSGQIGDDEFTQGIEYLIKQDIIYVPELTKTETNQDSRQIPSWIKTNSQWWADGMISDSEFTKGLEYLIKVGIIRV